MNVNPSRLGSALLIGAGVYLLGAGLWVGLQSRYQATARIKIVGDSRHAEPRWQGKEIPEAIQAGLAGVYSSLGTVAESLTLAGDWGMLKPSEAIARLRRNVDVHAVLNTSLIEIQVASRNSEEAAQIANRIAVVNGNLPRVQIIDSATTPTRRVFPNFAKGLKLIALGAVLLALGLFVLFDARRSVVARSL